MRHLKTVLTVIGAVTVLVLAANTVAMATTGHSFMLGKTNSANKATTLSRTTNGTVLTLHTKSSSSAPLSVNGHGKVANLNADTVDGLDSSAMVNKASVYSFLLSLPSTNFFQRQTPVLPAGSYLVTANIALNSGPTSGVPVSCIIQAYQPDQQITDSVPANAAGQYDLSLSGILRLKTAGRFLLDCGGPTGTYQTAVDGPAQISVVPLSQLTMGTATAP